MALWCVPYIPTRKFNGNQRVYFSCRKYKSRWTNKRRSEKKHGIRQRMEHTDIRRNTKPKQTRSTFDFHCSHIHNIGGHICMTNTVNVEANGVRAMCRMKGSDAFRSNVFHSHQHVHSKCKQNGHNGGATLILRFTRTVPVFPIHFINSL